MAVHTPQNLSRAVSFVDLSAALLKSQNSPVKMHYSREELLACRPETAPTPNNDVAKASAEDAGCPKPPPSTPYDPTITMTDHVNQTAADLAEIALNETGVQMVPAGSEAPKKKKKKSSGSNKKPKPTGFEEWYADKPLTPDEYKEESALYDESVPFCQRIEICMQRYRAKRNLDSTRNNILTKYFMLGGIDATPKAFTGGLDKETIQNSTAEEIRAMTATDFIRPGSKKYYDPEEPENWVVDFEGVAKGFFSERVPLLFCVDRQEDIKLYSAVIRNFLNYVLAHNVCPEYNDDVMAAREICNKAEKELWACQLLRWEFPGDFNMAASTLYGGIYQGMHVTTQTWEQEDPENEKWLKLSPGMSEDKSERIFRTAIAFEGDDKMFALVEAGDVHVVKTISKCVEIVKILRSSQESTQLYSSVKDSNGATGNIKPLGVLVLKPWEGPGTEEYESSGKDTDTDAASPSEITIWLEDVILEFLFVGMKMEFTLHELNIGVTYMDTLGGPYCSFYQSMENEKMVGWKEPVPNTRPAPNEDNPNIEEDAHNAEMNGNMKDDEKVSMSKNEVQKAVEERQK